MLYHEGARGAVTSIGYNVVLLDLLDLQGERHVNKATAPAAIDNNTDNDNNNDNNHIMIIDIISLLLHGNPHRAQHLSISVVRAVCSLAGKLTDSRSSNSSQQQLTQRY